MNTVAKAATTRAIDSTVAAGQSKSFGRLEYDISSCSSFSASYLPENIKTDRPQEQASRWSSGSNNQTQFITLKLDRLALVKTITFGKYHKVHVCNLKEFKVYGGVNLDNMVLLLHAGLRNDSEKETFALKNQFGPIQVPMLYIKIVPLLAHGANFNFSIWFVEVRGLNDGPLVQQVYKDYVNYKESQVLRLCLKHFRERNLLSVFSTLEQHAAKFDPNQKVLGGFEHPLMSDLHRYLVVQGDFSTGEQILIQASQEHLFDEYISDFAYKPIWRRITALSTPATSAPAPSADEAPRASPSMRGGHQMCIDTSDSRIYLFGGWDGSKDLCDFWMFDLRAETWTCLSMDTRRQGGPGPRSCHKICFDPKDKVMFLLGRYVDPESRPNVNLDCDFWGYHADSGIWRRISANTMQEGGPDLIYDHQVVMDPEEQMLYTFGGRTVGPDSNVTVYSGLYSYSIQQNTWTLLRSDTDQADYGIQLKSRIGHSMLLNQATKQLYIFAGQRNKDYLSDFYKYDIRTDTVIEVSRDYSVQGGPAAGFTQRATLDLELGEIYVLSGLMREKNNPSEMVKNSFWVYSLKKERWARVYQNENLGKDYWTRMGDNEPCPRFAHQLVYDPNNGKQYMFGGNPGDTNNSSSRLDDFWELSLERYQLIVTHQTGRKPSKS